MRPEVITEIAVPIRYRDALNDGATVWVSAPAVRGDPERARRAARMIAEGHTILRPQDILVAGTEQAEESLRVLITEWVHAGRPDHTALQSVLIPEPAGFTVKVRA